jgi:hypothetical protein
MTKVGGLKLASQEKNPGITSHAPGSAKECEGMNFHTPKCTPILGVESQMDSRTFRAQLQRFKTHHLEELFISL